MKLQILPKIRSKKLNNKSGNCLRTSFKYSDAVVFFICVFLNLNIYSYSKNIEDDSKLLEKESFGREISLPDSMHNRPEGTTEILQYGKILDTVKCTNKPGQSYSLYIPSQYIPGKKLPIIYIFDPAARGNILVELMKEAAERYGYIIAASNNSRNGKLQPEVEAAQAMFKDTHERLAIDDKCIYFAGFSGGARFAAFLAEGCKCAQGVLLNSAGFQAELASSSKDKFAVFAIAGLADFNYDEMVMLENKLDTLGIFHFLRRFNGVHEWAPKDVWFEAFAWMRLIAIKNGLQPRDEKFISIEMEATVKRAKAQEDSGNVYFAWQNYRNALNIFQGLADTKKIKEHIEVLEKKHELIEGREREKKEIDEQIKMQNTVLSIVLLMGKPKPKGLKDEQLDNYTEGGFTFRELRTQAQEAISKIRNKLENENKEEKRRVYERACDAITGYLMETAQTNMDSNDLQIAKNFFELATAAQPNSFRPHISIACCLVRMEDKEEAIHELRLARETGLSALDLADMTKQLSELSSLVDDPEFQKLISHEHNLPTK